jgi:hypothetical protein
MSKLQYVIIGLLLGEILILIASWLLKWQVDWFFLSVGVIFYILLFFIVSKLELPKIPFNQRKNRKSRSKK